MESPIEKGPNKKLFFFALAFFAVILLFVLISIFTPNSANQGSKSTTQNNLNTSTDSSPSSAPAKKMEGEAMLARYQNSLFSIMYPSDWKVEEVVFPNGEKGTSFYPKKAILKSPSMLIIESPGTANSMQQKQQNYKEIGFKSSNTLIDNNPAVKLSGTIPEQKESDKGQDIIEATHIFVRKGDTDYLLKYMYTDKGINKEFEELFTQMIASFKFN